MQVPIRPVSENSITTLLSLDRGSASAAGLKGARDSL